MLYRKTSDGIVHINRSPGNHYTSSWAPFCKPYGTLSIYSTKLVDEHPTCLWCVAGMFYK